MNLNNKAKYKRGMTLVELMVVLSIFAIISSMVMFNYSDYKSGLNIKVAGDEIALSIRQAQAYAMGVKSTESDGRSSFPGYGVHFNTSDGLSNIFSSNTCSDGIDNDGDGAIDDQDTSCIVNGAYDGSLMELSKNNPPVLYQCNDGLDDDGDNLVDAADPGCYPSGYYDPNFNDESYTVSSPNECGDGSDNDGDGMADQSDPSCYSDFNPYNPATYDSNRSESLTPAYPQCSDSYDNDNDGRIDISDPECHTDKDPNNTWSYDPNSNDESILPSMIGSQCQNRNDDDSDGFMDYDDPQCHTNGDPKDIHSYEANLDDEGASFVPPADCNDGIDNDHDGSIDQGDRSCYPDFNSSPSNSWAFDSNMSESRVSQCNDGIDNNSDGRVDIDDPNCHTDNNFKIHESYNSMWNDEGNPSKTDWMQCINGIDDNWNGMVDYDEPNCHSDGDPNNPNSYNPHIDDENDMNKIVFKSTPLNNLFKNLFNPISRLLSQAKRVFADNVAFNINGDSKSYVSFADLSCSGVLTEKGNNQYDYPNSTNSTPCGQLIPPTEIPVCDLNMIRSGSECISVTNIIGSEKIAGVCINSECESGTMRQGTLDIVFTRPNPDASFCYKAPGSINCTESGGISHAGVVLKSTISGDNRSKKITVWSTGQINVN